MLYFEHLWVKSGQQILASWLKKHCHLSSRVLASMLIAWLQCKDPWPSASSRHSHKRSWPRGGFSPKFEIYDGKTKQKQTRPCCKRRCCVAPRSFPAGPGLLGLLSTGWLSHRSSSPHYTSLLWSNWRYGRMGTVPQATLETILEWFCSMFCSQKFKLRA